jgi:putative ABC transport system permease protein
MPWLAWWFVPSLLFAAAITGILAGLYPAFYLSGFKPLGVLKGSLKTGSKNSVLRSGLVVFQFAASIILIICTLVVYNQMKFILNKQLGFDKDQVILVQGTNLLGPELKDFKAELLKLPAVKNVTVSDYLPVAGATRSGTLFYKEGEAGQGNGVGGQIWQVDPDYLKTLGIKLVAGRNFSTAMATDSQAVVINQSLANKLNLKNPVGQRITVGGKVAEVIGVTADFNFESLRDRIYGLCMQLGNSPQTTAVKVNPGDMQRTLAGISAVWKQFSPSEPIRYTFLDQRFAAMYADVQRMADIFTSFAILAVIISCLGLFALAAFMAEQRSKEIGIRKVLGASVQGITVLLSLDFVKLVGVAILIASPVAWFAMNKWLEDFAYRISVSWWILTSAALLAVSIALITVSFQSIKAALANPVKSLRSE